MSSITVEVPTRGTYVVKRDQVEIGRYTGDWRTGFEAKDFAGTPIGRFSEDSGAQQAIVAVEEFQGFLDAMPVASDG